MELSTRVLQNRKKSMLSWFTWIVCNQHYNFLDALDLTATKVLQGYLMQWLSLFRNTVFTLFSKNNFSLWWSLSKQYKSCLITLLHEDREWVMFIFFFLIWIHSMQGWTATTRHGVTWKINTKGLRHTGNLLRKNLPLKDVC